jgi:hypothetical protein
MPTPRVNGKSLQNYVGRVVFLLCDMRSKTYQGPNQIATYTSDGLPITLMLPPCEPLE